MSKSPRVNQDLFKECIANGFKHIHTEDTPNQDEVSRWMRLEYDIDIYLERCEVNGRKPPVYNGTVDSSHDATNYNTPLEYDEMQLKCIVEGLRFVKSIRDYNAGQHKSQVQQENT